MDSTRFPILNPRTPASPPVADFGSKAHFLGEMLRLGLPVPPAVAIPIDAVAARDWDPLPACLTELERCAGADFARGPRPMFLSVRTSPVRSIVGVVGGVLNVGFGRDAVHRLLAEGHDPRFVFDAYATFLQQIGNLLGVGDAIDYALSERLHAAGVNRRSLLDARQVESLAGGFEDAFRSAGVSPPADPLRQLEAVLDAVAATWDSDDCRAFRDERAIADRGMGIVVQRMVFGNRNARSCTAAGFSRSPQTGDRDLYGEFLVGGQGDAWAHDSPTSIEHLGIHFGPALSEVEAHVRRLERHFGRVQDFEFTIDAGELWFLQTRPARLTPPAAIRTAVELVAEGSVTPREAARLYTAADIETVLRPEVDDARLAAGDVVDTALPASRGVGIGALALDLEQASASRGAGRPYVLVVPDVTEEDLDVVSAAAGVVATAGGMTDVAAIVCRQLGVPCVSGATGLDVAPDRRHAFTPRGTLSAGDVVTIDGTRGRVVRGAAVLRHPKAEGAVATARRWLEEFAPRDSEA